MKYHIIKVLSLFSIICICFAKINHGMGIELTTDGSGIYYKQLSTLTSNSHFIIDGGFHFNNIQPDIAMFGYNNNYHDIMLDFTSGYRHLILLDKLVGPFSPIMIMGTGGIADLKSFSNDNIIGLWMIKYMVCFGIQFYNRMILNEVSIKFTHSKAIESHAAFHLAFYWK